MADKKIEEKKNDEKNKNEPKPDENEISWDLVFPPAPTVVAVVSREIEKV